MQVERADVDVLATDAVSREEEREKVISDDIFGDDIEYAGERSYCEMYSDAAVQEFRGDDGKEAYENNTEEAHGSKLKSTVNMEEVVAEINVKDKSFYSYADYVDSFDEEKIQMVGINENDDVMAVYEKLSSFFKKIGHKSDFDRLYEEVKRLADAGLSTLF